MNILSKITKGVQPSTVKAVIYGPPGVGKTTLAAGLPKPIVLDYEDGSSRIDVPRLKIKTYADHSAAMSALTGSNEFRTVVLDTVDWVETLIMQHMLEKLKVEHIEDIGYGKGHTYLKEAFLDFIADLDAMAASGKHIVCLAHSITKKISPPDKPSSYDAYALKLNASNADRLQEWAGMILFQNFDIRVEKGKDGRMRGIGNGDRYLYTQPSAAWTAKNRDNLDACLMAEPASILHLFGPVSMPSAQKTKAAPAPANDEDQDVLYDTLAPASTAPLPAGIEFLSANAARATAYLIEKKGWLKPGQTLADLAADKVATITKYAADFVKAVNNHNPATK